MFRSVVALRRLPAVLVSASVHAGAIAVGGHAFSAANSPYELPIGESTAVAEIAVELDQPPVPTIPQIQSEPFRGKKSVASVATHRHSYPIAPDHDARPHDPSIVHLPFAPADSHEGASTAALTSAAEAPAHFDLATVHTVFNASAIGRSGTGSRVEAAEGAGNGAYDEAQVSVPARLVESAPVDYPADARAAQVETDFKIELSVDASGRVVDARPLSRSDYGFERAAIRAVRAFRFSPAERQGRAVAVRMRWTVSFRLE